MKREIVTKILERTKILEELAFVAEYFESKDEDSCELLFGFAWGNEYYPGNEWPYESVKLNNLVEKVVDVEESGIGRLGSDDLFIKVKNLEFQFCHESDIHISYEEVTHEAEHFYERWQQQGLEPSEWLKNELKGPGEKLR